MSLEDSDLSKLESPPENKPELDKKPKIAYTREFLLSLSELEICKKVPKGVDPPILRELEETANSVTERTRYVPNRYDSKTGQMGRWETRSTGSSDKDSDTQSERDSFLPERRYGQYKTRNWQAPGGHDGLLGKPSGFVPSTSPSTTTRPYQPPVKRNTEPYQPPRPYKAGPYTRRDGVDSVNDETFGSTEISATEEEKKRRASFEMMRKEQHKVLQEKQNQKEKDREKNKEKINSTGDDILTLIQGSGENSKPAISQKEEGLDENIPSKSSSLSRPLVPPGFAGGERKLQKGLEVKNVGASEENKPQVINEGFIFNEKNKDIMMPISSSNNNLNKGSNSISILETFFGSTLSKNTNTFENQISKPEEEILIPQKVSESSKFAHWFTEEDSKPVEDSSSDDFLSLFSKSPNKEKITPIQDDINFEETLILNVLPNGPQKPNPNPNPSPPAVLTCEDLEQLMLAQAGISDKNPNNNIVINHDNNNNNNNNIRRDPNPNISTQIAVDNSASHHLLSLLQTSSFIPNNPNKETKKPYETLNPSTDLDANPKESVTLEAIFGAAFMNELHSMDAPVSSRKENNNNNNSLLLSPNLDINLPEEESLFSVNDPPLTLQPNPNSSSLLHPFANPNKNEPLGLGMFGNNMPDDNNNNLHNMPLSHDPNANNQRVRFIQQQHPQFDFDQEGRHVMMQNVHGFGPARSGPRPIHQVRQPGVMHQVRQPGIMHQVRQSGIMPHELTGVRNFPMQQQQPNFGIGIPGVQVGGSNQIHPEELERLMQMELRAKAQQQAAAAAAAAARIPGYYGPELDLDFRYR